ncbi:hypothetical protein [Exiguobacterium sp. ZOR0005]|uniref:hypothetical protein n=1 Tax=Exiguobacterium sp. ZOR0005 TaxID=1339226 RepID=UPI00064806CD|nr:hypothetical protein [Exiguobacterium sp. ZOR0005]
MKRMVNVVALGVMITVGLATYAVSGTESGTDWSLQVESNKKVWEDRIVQVAKGSIDQPYTQINVTLNGSTSSHKGSYFEQLLDFRANFGEDSRAFKRALKQLDYAQRIWTTNGEVAIGQKDRDTLVVLKSKDGKEVDVTEFGQAREILESGWKGFYVYDDKVHLLYDQNYETTNHHVATFDESTKTFVTQKIDRSKTLIGGVVGAEWSWYPSAYQGQVATDNRYIPIRATALETLQDDTGEEYMSEMDLPGLFVYDAKENKVVKVNQSEELKGTLFKGHEYRTIQSDGTELIIDLNSLEQTTRQAIQGTVGSVTYVDQLIYHVLPTTEGAMLEVYDEGDMVSRASIKAEGDSDQAANQTVEYYVY